MGNVVGLVSPQDRLEVLEALAATKERLERAEELAARRLQLVDDLREQVDNERERTRRWRERHDSLGKALFGCALMCVAVAAAMIWWWL